MHLQTGFYDFRWSLRLWDFRGRTASDSPQCAGNLGAHHLPITGRDLYRGANQFTNPRGMEAIPMRARLTLTGIRAARRVLRGLVRTSDRRYGTLAEYMNAAGVVVDRLRGSS
jgi:hypothetical protein